jgi:hypothetical protein
MLGSNTTGGASGAHFNAGYWWLAGCSHDTSTHMNIRMTGSTSPTPAPAATCTAPSHRQQPQSYLCAALLQATPKVPNAPLTVSTGSTRLEHCACTKFANTGTPSCPPMFSLLATCLAMHVAIVRQHHSTAHRNDATTSEPPHSPPCLGMRYHICIQCQRMQSTLCHQK